MNNKQKLIIKYLNKWFKNNLDSKYLPYVNNLFITSIYPFIKEDTKDNFTKFRYLFNWMAKPRYIMGEGETIHRIFGYDRNYCLDEVKIKSQEKKISNFQKYKFRLGIIPLIQEILIEVNTFIFVNIYFLLILIILIKNKSKQKIYSKFKKRSFQ